MSLETEVAKLSQTIEKLSSKIDNIDTSGGGSGGGGKSSSSGIFKGATDVKAGSFKDLTEETLKLYTTFDKMRASFSSFTGLTNEGVPVMRKYASAVRGLGIEYTEAAESFKTLVSDIPEFLNLDKKMQFSMGVQSARLSKLGIDYATTAKNITTMSKTLGFGNDQAMKYNTTLISFANALKQPPSIIMKDFAAAMPKLIQFGKEAPRIFMQTEVYAQKLKVSFDSLVDQMKQFDTFEDAAQAAGELNIILGRAAFSEQELLYQEPAERIASVIDTFKKMKEETGRGFNDLNIKQQKLFADRFQVDLETLKRMDNLSAEEAKQLAIKKDNIDVNKDGTEELRKAANSAVSVVERLAAKKDQLVEMTLPFLNVEKALGATTERMELTSKLIIGIAKDSEGASKAISAQMSANAADMLTAGSGITQFRSNLVGMINDTPGVGKAFEKIMPYLEAAGDEMLIYGDKIWKELSQMRLSDNRNFGALMGLDQAGIEETQKRANEFRMLMLDRAEGIALAAGLTPDQAKRVRNSEEEARQLFSDSSLKTLQAATTAARKFNSDMQQVFLDEEAKAKATGTDVPLFALLLRGMTVNAGKAAEEFDKQIDKLFDPGTAGSVGDRLKKSIENMKKFATQNYTDLYNYLGTTSLPGLQKVLGAAGVIAQSLNSLFTQIKNALSTPAPAGAPGSPGSASPSSALGFLGILGQTVSSFVSALAPSAGTVAGATIQILTTLPKAAQSLSDASANLIPFSNNIKSIQDSGFEQNALKVSNGLNNLVPAMKNFNSLTLNKSVLTNLDEVNNRLGNLKGNLEIIQTKMSEIKDIKIIDDTQINNLKLAADSMKVYADALKSLKNTKTEQQQFKEALEKLATVFAGADLKVDLDAEKMGRVMGPIIGNSVYQAVVGGTP